MRKLALKLSAWAIMLGLLFIGMGLWDIYKERNVNLEAVSIGSEDIKDIETPLVYAKLSGGRLDFTNTYELSLTTKKSDAKITSDFFTPIVSTNDGSVLYILKSPLEPTIQEMSRDAVYTGLLQSKSELPEKILNAYNNSYPNANFYYLDSTYVPETLISKIIDLKIFVFMLLIGFGIRRAVKPKEAVTDIESDPQVSDSQT